MRLLLDTHLLLWGARSPELLSRRAIDLIEDLQNELLFSSLSIAEIAIKEALRRPGFDVNAVEIRRGLLRNGYAELPFQGEHALGLMKLPPLHRDPFDRMLLAQAVVENVVLLTSDDILSRYPGPVFKV